MGRYVDLIIWTFVLGVIILLPLTLWAGTSAGMATIAAQGEQCRKNLQGETQYASMLHDERDNYEQQAAALVIERDALKKQIQEQGKQIQELETKLKAAGIPAATPAPLVTPAPPAKGKARVEE